MPDAQVYGKCFACIDTIRFIDERIGWLAGTNFLSTTDGGQHWSAEASPVVAALDAAGGRAFRIVGDQHPSECVANCRYRVEAADAGRAGWRPLPTPPFDGGFAQLVVDRPRIYALAWHHTAGGAQDAHASFVRSVDDGRTWRRIPDPCGQDAGGENDAFHVAAVRGLLAVECIPRVSGGRPAFLLVSHNAGNSWSRRSLPVDPDPSRGVAAIAAGPGGVLSVWVGPTESRGIATSHDEGRSWVRSLSVSEPVQANGIFLGYQDTRLGRAFWGDSRLWTTRDDGNSWTATEIRF